MATQQEKHLQQLARETPFTFDCLKEARSIVPTMPDANFSRFIALCGEHGIHPASYLSDFKEVCRMTEELKQHAKQ